MDSRGVDFKRYTLIRTPKSEPLDSDVNNDTERESLYNQSWIKPQMMGKVLSFTDRARDEPSLYRGSQVLLDFSAPGLMESFPQSTVFAASISAAAKHKSPSCKNFHQETTAPASVLSQLSPFLSHGSVQTNATISMISRPASATATAGNATTAPLTIFYNGTVSVYDVPAHKAESVMMLASSAISNDKPSSSPTTATCGPSSSKFMSLAIPAESFSGASAQQQTARKFITGLPVARKQSLQRFIEKRKERLNSTSTYTMKPTPPKTPSYEEGCGSASIVSPMQVYTVNSILSGHQSTSITNNSSVMVLNSSNITFHSHKL